jgi:hypothetical protein
VSQGELTLYPDDLMMIEWNKKGKPLSLPTHFLEKVGTNIGYGRPYSPGGFKYSLLIVDYKTIRKYIYGLGGLTGADVHNALVASFIEAGGIPGTIQCDFDNKLIAGSWWSTIRERSC